MSEWPDRFELMFVLLLGGYGLSALGVSGPVRVVTAAVYAAAFLLALRPGVAAGRAARWLKAALGTGSLAVAALVAAADGRWVDGVVALWFAAVLFGTVVAVLGRTLRHPVVTAQTVFGALNAYLLLGFMFAAVFLAIVAFDPRPFFASGRPADSSAVQYFSFVTLTTTGYGDLTAAGRTGQAVAVLEAVLGQVFLATLLARLVSSFGTVRRRLDGDGGTA